MNMFKVNTRKLGNNYSYYKLDTIKRPAPGNIDTTPPRNFFNNF